MSYSDETHEQTPYYEGTYQGTIERNPALPLKLSTMYVHDVASIQMVVDYYFLTGGVEQLDLTLDTLELLDKDGNEIVGFNELDEADIIACGFPYKTMLAKAKQEAS